MKTISFFPFLYFPIVIEYSREGLMYMCQDNDHGGKRCDSDTSEARRLRRKAKTLTVALQKNIQETVTPPVKAINPSSLKLSEFKEYAEELQKQVYAAPPQGVSQNKYDAQMEKKITKFGLALGEEADKMADFNRANQEKQLIKIGDEFYNEINKELKKIELEKSALLSEWRKLKKETEMFSDKSPWFKVEDLNEEEIAMLNPEMSAIREKIIANNLEDIQARVRYDAIDDKYDKAKELLVQRNAEKLTQSYQTILQTIRPLGGFVKVHKASEKEAQELINNTVSQYYPSAWLEHHNADSNGEVRVRLEEYRPSYNMEIFSETEHDGILKEIQYEAFLDVPDEYTEEFKKTFSHANLNELTYNHWFQGESTVLRYTAPQDEVYDPIIHGSGNATPPENERWEYRTTLSSLEEVTSFSEDSLKIIAEKKWVRPLLHTKKSERVISVLSQKAAKEITVRGNRESKDGAGNESTAYHEFGHRMEEVLPNKILPRQEKAFLLRRTGKNSKNLYQNMISSGNDFEFAHKGDFVSNYTGRDYFTGNNYEVFTTGIEAIYSGTYGGLVGNSNGYVKEDKDHRGFVLGMLATL
jgi:hypothetical protein